MSGAIVTVVALAAVVLGGWLVASRAGSAGGRAPKIRVSHLVRHGIWSLPSEAQAPISAALGAGDSAYRVVGLVARNPAQRLSARFGRSAVTISSGRTPLTIALRAIGRAETLRMLGTTVARADRNRVNYALGSVNEWWANGPLGLEQGFDITRRPRGNGALTLALAMPGATQLGRGTVALPGGLRYTGVTASDAGGGRLPAWLEVRGQRVLIRVNDSGARYPVRIDPIVKNATLTASDGLPGDEFGYSVAIAGNVIVVGAPHHENTPALGCSGSPGGVVYVFVADPAPGTGWKSPSQQELCASNESTNAQLGDSVAISPGYIAAGAPLQQGGGAVYVWGGSASSGWSVTQTAELTGSDATGRLGASVAIEEWPEAGQYTLYAGDPNYTESASSVTRQGAVLEYFNNNFSTWPSSATTPVATLTMSDPTGSDELGESLAIDSSNNVIVAGAPGHKSGQGSVYVFNSGRPLTGPVELNASDGVSGDQLGASVAISGNEVIAGAPDHTPAGGTVGEGAAYLWTGRYSPITQSTAWSQTSELSAAGSAELGGSVAVENDTVVAGEGAGAGQASCEESGCSLASATYGFVEPAGGWPSSDGTATELAGTASPFPGWALAIDGNTIVAGAPSSGSNPRGATLPGSAVVFTRPSPAIKIPSPANNATYGEGQSVTASYACTAPSGATITQCVGPVANGNTISTSAAGSYSFTVNATDSDGATTSRTVDYMVANPAVTAVDPAAGPLAGGNTVNIFGTGFAPGATVDFGTSPSATVTYDSVHELTAVVPAGTEGTEDVTVTSPDGSTTSSTSSADHYTYEPVPAVTAVSPDSGPTAGGNSITITGTGFVSSAKVFLGSTPSSSVTYVSSTELTAVVPAESAGLVNVRVSTPGGSSPMSSSDGYTFGPPTVTSVTPEAGPLVGGNSVTVRGSGFVSNASVSFGGTSAGSVTYLSPTKLTAVAPAEPAGTVNVQVSTGGGTSATSTADEYAFGPPTVSGVQPKSGSVAGGNTVTITGSGFTSKSGVSFGSTSATSVTYVSSTELTAVAPAESAGVVNVHVSTAAGFSSTSSADQYTFT